MTEHSILNLVHLTMDSLLDGISWWYEGRVSGATHNQYLAALTTYHTYRYVMTLFQAWVMFTPPPMDGATSPDTE